MITNDKIDQFFSIIKNSKNILILNSKPDGDSIGASLALNKILTKLDKTITSLSSHTIPDYLVFLKEKGDLKVKEILTDDDFKDYDCIIILDSGEIHRCLNNNVINFNSNTKFLCIDHHQFSNTAEKFEVKILDTKAESTCGLIIDMCKYYFNKNNVELIDEDTAFLLFAGIVSDTDYFGYNNVTKETFERAAHLKGFDFDQIPIIYKFRETLGFKAFQFIQRNINKVIVNEEKKYAYLKIKREDYADEDNLIIINEASNFLNRAIIRILDNVNFSFIIKEIDDKRSSIALRRHNNGNDVDLSQIAKKFGGGGHKQSAGGLVKMDIDSFERELCEYLGKLE